MEKQVTRVPVKPALEKLVNVAAYARVSSGKDAMLHSLAAQVSYYSRLISEHPGWRFAGVYADEALTGTKDAREEFQRMLADCREGKIDMVITKSVSRFARNTVTSLETVRELKSLGVDVYFEEQKIHSMSGDGELMLTILASYAQEESRSASENQKWRIRKSYERGEIMCWRYMFGYNITKDSIEIDPEEAPIVREMYQRVIAGESLSSVCRWLNENGHFGALGGKWCTPRLREALSNEKYLGNAMLQKAFVNNHLEKKLITNTGELPRYYVTETHPAIIDQETFDAAQAVLARIAKKVSGRAKRTVSELTSLITCGKCGCCFRRVHSNGTIGWNCDTFQTKGKAFCASKKIPEATLHALLCELLDMPVYDPGTVRSEVKGITVTGTNTLDIVLKDGSIHSQTWKDRSRRESWTPEMREKARQAARRRHRE